MNALIDSIYYAEFTIALIILIGLIRYVSVDATLTLEHQQHHKGVSIACYYILNNSNFIQLINTINFFSMFSFLLYSILEIYIIHNYTELEQ